MSRRNLFPGYCCACASPLDAGERSTERYCGKCAHVVRLLAAVLGLPGARRWLERPLLVLEGETPAARIANRDFSLVNRVAFDVVRKATSA
jgi:hypothetical protein